MTASEKNAALVKALREIEALAKVCSMSEAPLSQETLRCVLDDIAIHAGRRASEGEVAAA